MLPSSMGEGGKSGSAPGGGGISDALRAAVERTLQATSGSTAETRERAVELLDEVARRGREARAGLTRRGQEAGAGLARRGQATRGEVVRQLEALESRLAAIEALLRRQIASEDQLASEEDERGGPNPKGKG
jgi:hypothetical protein